MRQPLFFDFFISLPFFGNITAKPSTLRVLKQKSNLQVTNNLAKIRFKIIRVFNIDQLSTFPELFML